MSVRSKVTYDVMGATTKILIVSAFPNYCYVPSLSLNKYDYLILSYLFTDAPTIQKIIASYAYLWFVFSPAFLLEI